MYRPACASTNPQNLPRVLVDSHNVDGVLSELLRRRPEPYERPRWDRVREYLRLRFAETADFRFVIDQRRVCDAAFPLYRALRSMRWNVVPTAAVGRYPGNDDPVDEFILDRLHESLALTKSGISQPVSVSPAKRGGWHQVISPNHFGARKGGPQMETIVARTQNARIEEHVGDGNGHAVMVWKVAPGEHARIWDECRESGCTTINWLNHVNFNDFATKLDIKRALSKEKPGHGGAPFIWHFVKDIQRDDIVVANNGLSRVEGIGIVETRYLHPDHPRNPRRKEEDHRHARRVKWLIDKPLDLHQKLFNQPAVERLDLERWSIIKRAYLRQYPELKQTFDVLFPDDSQSDQAEDIEEVTSDRNTAPTTKKALIDARLGQGKFRKSVLKRWARRCSVTFSATEEAIRASHIKPWRESTNDERLDPENGLPLIASLDALFDNGLISFEATGRMIVSSEMSPDERKIFRIGECRLIRPPTAKMTVYLALHRRKHGFVE